MKHGVLLKKGDTLKLYKKQYNIYLEKRDDLTGRGPYLKCGRVGGRITRCVNLAEHANIGESDRSMNMTGGQGAIVIKSQKNSTKFCVITSKIEMKLKAKTMKERDEWCRALVKEIQKGNGNRESSIMISQLEVNLGQDDCPPY